MKLQRQIADLGMQQPHVDRRLRRLAAAGTEYIGGPALKLRLARCNLIGVKVELFGWRLHVAMHPAMNQSRL